MACNYGSHPILGYGLQPEQWIMVLEDDGKPDPVFYDYDDLVAFYKEVAELTFNHEVDTSPMDRAWVSPAKLARALEKIDPDWWKVVKA